ncbi:MAG TPA: DUF3363 domain-containing protein [Caulobacterales bacterium]|nr:DUF3363 domain-containing protein [Caulobacterales bacterium]
MLARDVPMPDGPGRFAQEFEQRQRLFLIEQGLMGCTDMALSPDALDRLASRELQSMAHRLEKELGRPILTQLGAHFDGVYARRRPVSGTLRAPLGARDGAACPLAATLEHFAGRHVQGFVRGQLISWGLWRGSTVGLPPM